MQNIIKTLGEYPDISFIGNDSLQVVRDRMIANFQNKYKELTGTEMIMARGDPNRLVLYSCALEIYQGYQYIDAAGKEGLLKYSFGDYLENLGALKGISRAEEAPAHVTERFFVSQPLAFSVPIPYATRVCDAKQTYFATDTYAEIPAGQTYADVPCTAVEPGEQANGIPEGQIATLVDATAFISAVSNVTVSANGSEQESDTNLKQRIYLAPASWSTAGPDNAYEYWARYYNTDVLDVLVTSLKPGDVNIFILMAGPSLPSKETIKELTEKLKDEQVRPLTDNVIVSAPNEVDFDLDFTYYINRSDASRAASIQYSATKAMQDYIEWQTQKIGRDINTDMLVRNLIQVGVKRVEINSPKFTRVGPMGVAVCKTQRMTYGGLEDD